MKAAMARLTKGQQPRTTGKIGGWPEETRQEFERDCIAKVLTMPEIAAKYDVPLHTVRQYKYRWLKPEMVRQVIRKKVQIEESAKGHLAWMLNETKDSIDELRGRKKDEDGEPIKGDPKTLGNMPELLGRGFEGVRLLGEFLGEIGNRNAAPANTVMNNIKVICVPKAEGTPMFEADEDDGPDYASMKLIDVATDGE